MDKSLYIIGSAFLSGSISFICSFMLFKKSVLENENINNKKNILKNSLTNFSDSDSNSKLIYFTHNSPIYFLTLYSKYYTTYNNLEPYYTYDCNFKLNHQMVRKQYEKETRTYLYNGDLINEINPLIKCVNTCKLNFNSITMTTDDINGSGNVLETYIADKCNVKIKLMNTKKYSGYIKKYENFNNNMLYAYGQKINNVFYCDYIGDELNTIIDKVYKKNNSTENMSAILLFFGLTITLLTICYFIF